MVFSAGMQERVILSSFNHYTLLRCKKIAPQILCGALEESWIVNFGGYAKGLGLECVHPLHWYLTKENMEQLKEQGLRVHTWTVNEPEQMRRLIDLGADIIITNHPDRLAEQLRDLSGAGRRANRRKREDRKIDIFGKNYKILSYFPGVTALNNRSSWENGRKKRLIDEVSPFSRLKLSIRRSNKMRNLI